jgi:hypothetical protein
MSTSTPALRAASAGTEPRIRPANVFSPRLPTTSRSAERSATTLASVGTGSPSTTTVSILSAPARLARSLAVRTDSSAGVDPTTW